MRSSGRIVGVLLAALAVAGRLSAQTTLSADRLRLTAGPCGLSSAAGSPNTLVLTPCPVVTTAAATSLTLKPTGDLITDPTGNDILPAVNYDISIGSPTLKYLSLSIGELLAETLVAQDVLSTIGGRVIVAPTTLLTADLSSGATSIQVKHNNLANGDRVYLQAAPGGVPQVEFLAITSGAGGSAGAYTYSVTRNLDGSGANPWTAGDAVLNTGTTGSGFIDLYSTAGVLTGSGPTIAGNVRTGTTFNAIAPRWAIGNLNGLYGYASTVFGSAFGNPSATNITIDETNGFRIRSGTTNKLIADTSGNLSLTGDLSLGTSSVFRSSTATGPTTGDGFYMTGGSTPYLRIGQPAGNRLVYDASSGLLNIYGNGSGLTSIGPGSLTVGSGRNTIRNSDCVVGVVGWSIFTNSGHTILQGSNSTTARLNTGPNTCWFGESTAPGAGTLSEQYILEMTPVTAGARYEGSAYLVGFNTGNSLVQIQWLNGDGSSQIGVSSGNTCAASGVTADELAEFCRSGVVDVAPAGTKNARLIVITTHTGATNPVVFHVHNYFGEAQSGQTELTPWGPAGITPIIGGMIEANTITATNIAASTITATQIAASTITGAKIAANTITAGNIAAGTITATEIAAATITGAKIAAGTLTASHIDTTTITALGAVTAGSFNIGSGNFSVTSGGVLTATLATFNGGTEINGGLVVNTVGPSIMTLNTTLQIPGFGGGGTRRVCVDNSGFIFAGSSC